MFLYYFSYIEGLQEIYAYKWIDPLLKKVNSISLKKTSDYVHNIKK